MTLLELSAKYGKKEYISSAGDSIGTLVDKLYNSRDDRYYQILLGLNARYDWDCIAPGSTIYYIPKFACNEYSEYSSRW